jgi:hypothetical protein
MPPVFVIHFPPGTEYQLPDRFNRVSQFEQASIRVDRATRGL